MSNKYAYSTEYQKEIAQQYKKRISKFTKKQVINTLKKLQFKNLPNISEIIETEAGNVNATYLTPKLVIKLSQNRKQSNYLANKIISDNFGNNLPVIEVLVYDNFEKTDFEVLVMKRSPGIMWMEDVVQMSELERENIFEQVLDVVIKLFTIKFSDFGMISLDKKESFPTYSKFLLNEFDKNINKIRKEELAKEHDIFKIEKYFKKHISIFDDSESVFIHTDIHMGNILHSNDKLTAIIDFDQSLKAPKVRTLISLLGFIDSPQQFVEGTNNFEKFKNINFQHLLKNLKNKFPEIFSDPLLLRKLNIMGLNEIVMWISQNWSNDWNAEMITEILKNELPKNNLSKSYYGKFLN
jgi:hypothetical protein